MTEESLEEVIASLRNKIVETKDFYPCALMAQRIERDIKRIANSGYLNLSELHHQVKMINEGSGKGE